MVTLVATEPTLVATEPTLFATDATLGVIKATQADRFGLVHHTHLRCTPSLQHAGGLKIGQLAPRELGERGFYQLAGRAAGPNLTRGPAPASLGQAAPCRPTALAAARRPHRRASTGAGAAAPRPRPQGRCPPRKPPKTAKTGQNGPKNGSDRCPRETPGRPPARSEAPARGQLGPFSTLGGYRLASWHRASSASAAFTCYELVSRLRPLHRLQWSYDIRLLYGHHRIGFN
jgi:hypothetical protein